MKKHYLSSAVKATLTAVKYAYGEFEAGGNKRGDGLPRVKKTRSNTRFRSTITNGFAVHNGHESRPLSNKEEKNQINNRTRIRIRNGCSYVCAEANAWEESE